MPKKSQSLLSSPNQNSFFKAVIIAAFIFLPLAAFIAGKCYGEIKAYSNNKMSPPPIATPYVEAHDMYMPEDSDQTMCTMDAMLCPDGSYVGRSGPSCEFDPCPSL